MKKIVLTLFTISLGLHSCAESDGNNHEGESSEAATVSNDDVITDETDQPEEEIVSKYAYDKDWEMIKEAIINKDIPGLGAWAGSDAFDAEMFIGMAQEDWVMDALKATSYDDLKTEEMEDGVYLVFYAEITGMDDEGNEYGSSITLYMSQGDPNLMVEYFIAAG